MAITFPNFKNRVGRTDIKIKIIRKDTQNFPHDFFRVGLASIKALDSNTADNELAINSRIKFQVTT